MSCDHVVGVQAERFPAMFNLFKGMHLPQGASTIAEGIAVGQPGQITRRIVADRVDDMVLVDEGDIEQAIVMLLEIEKTLVEGAGAAGLAALLKDPARYAGKRVGLVLCGGNIDPLLLAAIIERGMVRAGRLARIRVGARDAPGVLARCTRCDAPLYRNRPLDLDVMLALALTALIVLVLANVFPIVTLQVSNTEREATLWGAILATYDTGVAFVALLAALTVFFFPLLQILLYLHVLLPMRWGLRTAGFRYSMHLLRAMQPWSMVEVFVLGVLVAVVKLAGMAEVTPQLGMWGFALLTVLLTLLNSFDLHQLWDIAQERCDG